MAQDPTYLTRAEVGLRPPKSLSRLDVPVDTLFIHHTDTQGKDGPKEWVAVQRFHMDTRMFADIAYHGGIGPLAEVMEGRPPAMDGGATLGWNQRSLAICFVGDFTSEPATIDQLRSAAWLGQYWMLLGLLSPRCVVMGHRDESTSSCPGDALYAQLPQFRQLLFAPVVQQQEANMQGFVQASGDAHVWLSDGFQRRWMRDMAQVARTADQLRISSAITAADPQDIDDLTLVGPVPTS